MTPATAPLPDTTLVRALHARLQADAGREVRCIETHISWVLLDGEHAWKLKKPVRMGFLDFTTVEARAHFCEEELRLNRRLAPSLYLRVVAVRGTPQSPRLDGGGPAIDHLVQMRQFLPGSLLSERLAAGTLLPDHVERLAHRLAAFHESAPMADPRGEPRGDSGGDHGSDLPIEAAAPPDAALLALDRLAALVDSPDAQASCRTLRAWLQQQATRLAPVQAERRRRGRVRECHGDLHLDNVVMLGEDPTPFDCIEFDAALRWIDVADDIAFVAMDLMARGRRDLAWRALNTWFDDTGDHDALRVLRHQLVYRAIVRALVQQLRPPGTGGGNAAPDYLGCATALADAAQAGLLITHGLSGSGKSHVARAVAEQAGALRLRSDVERKRLHGLAPLERSAGRVPDLYAQAATQRTFDHLLQLARCAMAAGWPVVVDAAFLRHEERDAFARTARLQGVPFAILHCDAPEAVLRQRVQARALRGDDASEADLTVLARQMQFAQPLSQTERACTLSVDTTGPLDAADLVRRWLG